MSSVKGVARRPSTAKKRAAPFFLPKPKPKAKKTVVKKVIATVKKAIQRKKAMSTPYPAAKPAAPAKPEAKKSEPSVSLSLPESMAKELYALAKSPRIVYFELTGETREKLLEVLKQFEEKEEDDEPKKAA